MIQFVCFRFVFNSLISCLTSINFLLTDEKSCYILYDFLRKVGFNTETGGFNSCMIFDEDAFNGGKWHLSKKGNVDELCGVSLCICMITPS